MPFYFRNFPFVSYDIDGDGISQVVQNPLVRFKIVEKLQNSKFLYQEYIIEEESASEISFKFYGNETLDWVIYVTNNIIDPKYDWPLGYRDFNNFIIKKYGSVENASRQTTTDNIHHYEWIVQQQQVLFDGTKIPERRLIIDKAKYDTLPVSERDIVRNFEYEQRLNDDKRNIKLLREEFLQQFLAEVRSALSS
jgi:hypothetical protein